ncbi:MAG: Sjogren's syndrome/scleroderma autoantigen 1 family protein [Acidilobus sp.]
MSSKEGPDLRKDPKVIKLMANLMAQGAVMLEQTCPICGLPLFRLKNGDVVCPVHGKVYIVSSDEEAREVEIDETLRQVEYVAAIKIREYLRAGEIDQVGDLLGVMEAAERVMRLRLDRARSQQPSQPSPQQARAEEPER